MGWINMDVCPITQGGAARFSYEKDIQLDTVGVSDWIIIPKGIKDIAVHLYLTDGATASVETSMDLICDIKSGTEIYQVWTRGIVFDDVQDSCHTVSAIRLRMNSIGINGTARLQIKAT